MPVTNSGLALVCLMLESKFKLNEPILKRLKELKISGNVPKPKPIVRTVENDIELIDDPMDEDFTPRSISSSNRQASLQLKIIAHNIDNRESRTAVIQR